MCRIEERIYVAADGTRQKFEDPNPCHKARRGKLCSNVSRKVTEYHSQPPSVTRDDASSPASMNPPTPTGTYLVKQHRPSGSGRQPSTKDGTRVIKPEIVIEFGSKKDKTKKYPGHSSGQSSKRASLGTHSIASSNEVHIDSPGSDASYAVRTGFPEAPVPPPTGYNTVTAVPQSHHRHTSSASSFTTSSQPPSLYATPEPDSPTKRRPARYPPTIVHNPLSGINTSGYPPSPTATRNPAPSSPSYRIAVPNDSAPRDNIAADGLFPLDYSEFRANSSFSNGSGSRAAAPEITDRDADRAWQRQQRAEAERRRQEQADRELAHTIAEEEARQARFEIGRAQGRAKERAENQFAESEKRRAEEREEVRRRRKDQDEKAARDAKKEKALKMDRDRLKEEVSRRKKQAEEAEAKVRASEKRDSRPPTRDRTSSNRQSRRMSISQEIQLRERELLLAETKAQMAREREAAEQREREERAAFLRQQQQTSQYWDPRRDDRYPVPNDGPGVSRRPSVSSRRPSISSQAPSMGLGRSGSRRVSIHQAAPPSINTNVPQPNYSTRPPSAHRANPPPLFSPSSSTHPTSSRPYSQAPPPSARHSSYTQDNPFAQPPSARHSPPIAAREHWDIRDNLPQPATTAHHRQLSEDRPKTLRRRGEDVINNSEGYERSRQHDRARQATKGLGKVVGFEDDYDDSDEENEEDKIAGMGPRLGLGKGGKRRS
ncbi:hypothetical protein K469DRAFT_692240 [Zopfia rhizophila CBS 207.26]|uniref:Uncharacterized protein n=1 Tax=Zopfia rhizophila CBS 207.26 TaxID=1314779 RepID=A0A6A6DPC5_9PEZI|nr:hypothetical protein K469DRAFT_692240 [Zopfia rhizophila CBS 207.26]